MCLKNNKITYKKLISIINQMPYSFIIDKFNEQHSIIGFNSEDFPNFKIIVSNSLDDLEIIYTNNETNSISFRNKYALIQPGWFGYLSYDLKNNILPFIKAKPTKFPLIQFIYTPIIFYFDHCSNNIIPISKENIITDYYLDFIKSSNSIALDNFYLTLKYIQPFDLYQSKIKIIKELIENGEVYQINYAHQLIFEFNGDPLNCYLSIREKAKPAFGCYFKFKDLHILSFSPERFFKVRNNIIQSFPIKGTMPRSNIKSIDKLNKKILSQSEKDRAEHIMIVDLIRNDLGKICKIGSVKVNNLFSIKSYETIHHMVSRISGKLIKPYNLQSIVKAIFPGGSVTGAPKIAAIKYINELEDFTREIYTGSIGYILPNNSFIDFNIAIRTMIIYKNIAYYAVGGGIVFDSDPLKEYKETITKSLILNHFINIIN